MVFVALAPAGAWPRAGPAPQEPRAVTAPHASEPLSSGRSTHNAGQLRAVPAASLSCLALGCAAAARAVRRGRRSSLRGRHVLLRAGDDSSGAFSREKELDYGEKEYWDKRYEEDEGDNYDWLGGYSRYKEFIDKAMADLGLDKKTARILDLGCGNAKLAEQMYDDGYRGITAVDISEVVIADMKERNTGKREEIKWVVGNAFELEFEDDFFDIVIDKSTTDAVSCDEDNRYSNLVRMTGQVSRVLRSGGSYLVFSSVTHIPPLMLDMRHNKFDWSETKLEVPFCEVSAFVATKAPGADIALTMNYADSLEYAEAVDRQGREARQKQAEAEQRLKDQAPSSFAVLD